MSLVRFCILAIAIIPSLALPAQKIGLVLSGGGARGLAHIGVIRALEENGVQVAAIAGTSIGAIVGALYASGRSPAEMEEIAVTLDWGRAFDDQTPREHLNFRRKQDSREYLVKAQATLKNGVLSLPKGVIQGQNLQLLLQDQFLHASHITDFDDLPIPFRAVTGDLVTGESVAIGSGDLATAVRASMSIPGLYAPVELEGRVLVDGGIANNVPIDVVRKMGIDKVIVIDIASPLYNAEQLDSVLPIIEQLTTLLTQSNARQQLATLTQEDLLITPDLHDVQAADFDKAALAIQRGYEAAQQHLDALLAFRGGSGSHRKLRRLELQTIDRIIIRNESPIADKLIMSRVRQLEGEVFDKEQLEEDIQVIYGLSYFESVNYVVDERGGEHVLEITTIEKSWGQDLIGLSFELFTDNDGESGYNLAGNFRKYGVTRKGGEWFSVGQIGENPTIRTELYLPLDYQQRFFLKPYAKYSETSFNLVRNTDIESRFNIDDLLYGLFLGTELSNVATFGVGIEEHRGHSETFVGIDTGTVGHRDVSRYALFELDTLNNLYFPNRGLLASVRYDRVEPKRGNKNDFDLVRASWLNAFSIGPHSLIFNARLHRSSDPVLERLFQTSLGGLLNLSGYPDNALVGSDLLFVSLTYMHRLDKQGLLPIDLPVYVGISAEAGNVWNRHQDISTGDLIASGALLLGVDSPLGPLYFGYGKSQDGNSSFYLRLGRVFQ